MANFRKRAILRGLNDQSGKPFFCGCTSLFLVYACCVTGCGSRGPKVEFVEGLVILDNQPVADATVFFLPLDAEDAGQGGLPAAGRTGSDGSFRLNATQGARAGGGTAVGTYLVTVTKQEGPPVPEPDASGYLPPAPTNFKVRDLLPARYGDRETTPLQADVQPGNNRFRFELTSANDPPNSNTKQRE